MTLIKELEALADLWEARAEKEDRRFHEQRETTAPDLLEGMVNRAQTYKLCAEELRSVGLRGEGVPRV